DADIDELKMRVRQRSDALVAGDVATLQSILADGFAYIDASGTIFNKADYIANHCGNLDVEWHFLESNDIAVHPHGDTAFITCVVHFKARFGASVYEAMLRSSFTYVKQGNSWRCIGGQRRTMPNRA